MLAEKGKKVIKYLKGDLPEEDDSVHMSQKDSSWLTYPPVGLKDVLCVPEVGIIYIYTPNEKNCLCLYRRCFNLV